MNVGLHQAIGARQAALVPDSVMSAYSRDWQHVRAPIHALGTVANKHKERHDSEVASRISNGFKRALGTFAQAELLLILTGVWPSIGCNG